MDDKNFEERHFEIKSDDPVFIISVVSKMVDIPIWTLRKLDELGIVCPKRIGKKTRCYSKTQIKKLSYICYLMQEERINISGVKFILEQKGGDHDEG